jgi:transposase InsO family protein
MGRVACALDNSAAEAFNSTLKTGYAHRKTFTTRARARRQIGAWIDQFHNRRRRHSWCGGISPIDHEQQEPQRQQDQQRSAA